MAGIHPFGRVYELAADHRMYIDNHAMIFDVRLLHGGDADGDCGIPTLGDGH